ncbi:hypothetical protein F511_02536 [Dorcoceras hygrometricum]|nr:hypothetical protein F511_02536 [Dorcoceras hygrometricum]
MKSWLVISLLFSSFMIHEAQGVSLRRGSLLDDKNDIHRKFVPLNRINDGGEEDGEGLTIIHQVKKLSGRSRKLIVSTTSTTKTAKNAKNEDDKADLSNPEGSSNKEKMGKKEEKLSVNSSSQNQATREVYPDVMDIAGMDYSQARRRPPIHN